MGGASTVAILSKSGLIQYHKMIHHQKEGESFVTVSAN